MIKKCPIVINNSALTVVDFDGELVQFQSIRNINAKSVNVLFEDGKYSIVKDMPKKLAEEKPRKKSKKENNQEDKSKQEDADKGLYSSYIKG